MYNIFSDKKNLEYNHTERQAERQASASAAAAASPMQVYGDASLDAPNGSQIHCINLTLHLPLTLDARCGYSSTHCHATSIEIPSFKFLRPVHT